MWKIKFEKIPSTTKEDKLLEKVKVAVEEGGWEAAKEVCRNTKGNAAYALYMFIDEVVQKYD